MKRNTILKPKKRLQKLRSMAIRFNQVLAVINLNTSFKESQNVCANILQEIRNEYMRQIEEVGEKQSAHKTNLSISDVNYNILSFVNPTLQPFQQGNNSPNQEPKEKEFDPICGFSDFKTLNNKYKQRMYKSKKMRTMDEQRENSKIVARNSKVNQRKHPNCPLPLFQQQKRAKYSRRRNGSQLDEKHVSFLKSQYEYLLQKDDSIGNKKASSQSFQYDYSGNAMKVQSFNLFKSYKKVKNQNIQSLISIVDQKNEKLKSDKISFHKAKFSSNLGKREKVFLPKFDEGNEVKKIIEKSFGNNKTPLQELKHRLSQSQCQGFLDNEYFNNNDL